jgi:hypothetical protein
MYTCTVHYCPQCKLLQKENYLLPASFERFIEKKQNVAKNIGTKDVANIEYQGKQILIATN